MTRPAGRHSEPTAESIEREVAANVLAQPCNGGTVAQLNLPAEFVRRCADRAIISSFNERYRVIVGNTPRRVEPAEELLAGPEAPRVVEGITHREDGWQDKAVETREIARGFRFGVRSADRSGPSPHQGPYERRRAAEIAVRTLASDGLLLTALAAGLAVRALIGAGDERALALELDRAGLPIDLLAMYECPGSGGFARGEALGWLHARMKDSRPTALREVLRSARLSFRPTLSSFRATDEAGGAMPMLARLQLTRGDDWIGPGDGGALDIARQAAHALSDVRLVLSCRQDHLSQIRGHTAAWQRLAGRSAPLEIISEAATLSQWARDNACAGTVEATGGGRAPAAILPRFASRGDEVTAFVPGDSAAAESLRSIGVVVERSPLHFQGGNAALVWDPRTSQRVLLIGEAEVHRNVGLGLTSSEARDALREEFGADHVVALPAASYHIDNEVFCLRDPQQGQITAFVADHLMAAKLIVSSGLGVLSKLGALHAADGASQDVLSHDAAGLRTIVERAALALQRIAAGHTGTPLEVAERFTAGTPGESGAGNFMVFVDALDTLAAQCGFGNETGLHPHAAAGLRARQRLDEDRVRLADQLRQLDWRVVSIPSYNSGPRGACTLNAVRAGDRVLVPEAAGLLGAVSAAARTQLTASMPDFEFIPVSVAESQRRNGACHCAISLFG